jgi:hypothetical protein
VKKRMGREGSVKRNGEMDGRRSGSRKVSDKGGKNGEGKREDKGQCRWI